MGSATTTITLSLFGNRSLRSGDVAMKMLGEIIDLAPFLRPDSWATGPVFRRKALPRTDLTPVAESLRNASDIYSVHVWDDNAMSKGEPSLFFQAASHGPAFHHLMLNLPRNAFERIGVQAFTTLADRWAASLDLISGYAHDLDDFSFQNESNVDMFTASGRSLSGYRMKSIFRSLRREIDVERNPGHHHFVDGRMFTVAWVTYFGDEMARLYGAAKIAAASWESVETIGSVIVGRLYADPFDPDTKSKRRRQALVRAELGVDEIAHRLLMLP